MQSLGAQGLGLRVLLWPADGTVSGPLCIFNAHVLADASAHRCLPTVATVFFLHALDFRVRNPKAQKPYTQSPKA